MPQAFPRDGSVTGKKLTASIREGRYFYDRFHHPPRTWLASDPSTIPVGATGTENILFTERHQFRYTVLGTQTIVAPTYTTDGGINFGLDQTLNDGVEINFSETIAGHPRSSIVGTHDAFFRARVKIQNVSGANIFFGLRKIEATATALATYTDKAGIRVLGDSTSAAAPISIITNKNDSADAEVPTTQTLADLTAVEFEVRFRGNRFAEFFINGVETTVKVTTFQFDTLDELCPVIYSLNTTDFMGEFNLQAVEGGALADRRTGLLP